MMFTWLPVAAYAEHSSFDKMVVVSPKTSKNAPNFVAMKLKGDDVELSGFKEKVVLLSFWATWCGACIEEMAFMQNLYSSLREFGVEVIPVSIDRWKEERI
jgi:peroxiredoxin